jgi:RIO kinase 1
VSLSLTTDRPAPGWLVEHSFEEQVVGVLKSGKEAEVFLVERRSAEASCLLAHKRYRPRRPGQGELRDLGFSKGTSYHNDLVYRQGWFLTSRDRRAVETHTAHGRDVVARLWPANEFEMLRRAWDAGASVPYPVARTDDGVLMEYVGDEHHAAPRLVEARLDRDALEAAWRQLFGSLERLARAGVVHGDLSVYNLLWWDGRVSIIDFPQAVDATTNPAAFDLLHRDLQNVATWFGRRGVAVDVEAGFAELLGALLY